MKLYPHQKPAVSWLVSRDRAGFFDDQGLGKTCTSLVAAGLKSERVLAITPTAVVHNWAKEARKWNDWRTSVLDNGRAGICAGSQFVSMTHGMLLNKRMVQLALDYDPEVVILDEAHQLRGETAKKAGVFYSRFAKQPVVWCLTGTPQPGWPTDLWRMLSGLWPSEFSESFNDFRARYCQLAPSDFGDGWRPVGTRRLGELRQRVKGKFLRRLKKDVLDLPPLRHEHVVIKAKMPQEMMALDAEERKLLKDMADPEKAFRRLLGDANLASFCRRIGEVKAPIVADIIEAELEHRRDIKRVLFCHHTSVARNLQQGGSGEGRIQYKGMLPEANFGPRPTVDEEHHLALTISPSGEVNAWVDGVQIQAQPPELTGDGDDLNTLPSSWERIGASAWGDAGMSGTVNEFRIWRGRLSEEQVTTNFENGPDSLNPPPPFAIISIVRDPDTGDITLTWNSKAGRSYAVESSTDMSPTNPPTWLELDDSSADSDVTSYTAQPPPGTTRLFYRIREISDP